MKKRKSTKGVLIKEMSKKLPREILKDSILETELKELINDVSGIYALYRNDELYYVGMTTNLYKRIIKHSKNKHAKKWNKFAIFKIKKVKYLKDIETIIVNIIKTLGNRQKGKLPKDSNLNRSIKNILKKKTRELSKSLK